MNQRVKRQLLWLEEMFYIAGICTSGGLLIALGVGEVVRFTVLSVFTGVFLCILASVLLYRVLKVVIHDEKVSKEKDVLSS